MEVRKQMWFKADRGGPSVDLLLLAAVTTEHFDFFVYADPFHPTSLVHTWPVTAETVSRAGL